MYKGTLTLNFTVIPKYIDSEDILVADAINTPVYDGESHKDQQSDHLFPTGIGVRNRLQPDKICGFRETMTRAIQIVTVSMQEPLPLR